MRVGFQIVGAPPTRIVVGFGRCASNQVS